MSTPDNNANLENLQPSAMEDSGTSRPVLSPGIPDEGSADTTNEADQASLVSPAGPARPIAVTPPVPPRQLRLSSAVERKEGVPTSYCLILGGLSDTTAFGGEHPGAESRATFSVRSAAAMCVQFPNFRTRGRMVCSACAVLPSNRPGFSAPGALIDLNAVPRLQ
ncbi:hypothetical protein GSI_14769 [Ganoderma sinense ZZ0214-1]|uniref:Uncharacterized protein n=1 Tax=Ganoderma sinense ZZ0214-1 TaxID=1077348 RepID=A0A2G8RQ38_9APHY|nr:hypothetical protein GSI_14769 [Ganoderma sinense ZZ0214-1]